MQPDKPVIIRTIAKRVREARNERGLTQDQLAEKVGLTRVSINHIENSGIKTIKPENIQRIAKALEKPEAYFYGEATHTLDSLPDSLRKAVTRLFVFPGPQQEKLGRIIEKIVDWYEAEVIR